MKRRNPKSLKHRRLDAAVKQLNSTPWGKISRPSAVRAGARKLVDQIEADLRRSACSGSRSIASAVPRMMSALSQFIQQRTELGRAKVAGQYIDYIIAQEAAKS